MQFTVTYLPWVPCWEEDLWWRRQDLNLFTPSSQDCTEAQRLGGGLSRAPGTVPQGIVLEMYQKPTFIDG